MGSDAPVRAATQLALPGESVAGAAAVGAEYLGPSVYPHVPGTAAGVPDPPSLTARAAPIAGGAERGECAGRLHRAGRVPMDAAGAGFLAVAAPAAVAPGARAHPPGGTVGRAADRPPGHRGADHAH